MGHKNTLPGQPNPDQYAKILEDAKVAIESLIESRDYCARNYHGIGESESCWNAARLGEEALAALEAFTNALDD